MTDGTRYTTTFWELWVDLTGCLCRSEVFSELQKQWGTIPVLYQLNLDEIQMKILYVNLDDAVMMRDDEG